jgi:hypothetical protein
MASLSRAAPLFEEAYEVLHARGVGDHQLGPVLGALALSAYYVDRRYEARFGELAIGVLALGFDDAVAQPSAQFIHMFSSQLAPKMGSTPDSPSL